MTLNTGTVLSGYSGFNATLNAVQRFLTVDGYTPATDPNYFDETDWYKSAGLGADGDLRDHIINLCTLREPRFYAWIGFDGGDYTVQLKNGEPLRINMLSNAAGAQGFLSSTRDNSISGFFTQKYLPPTLQISLNNAYVGYVAPSRMVFRLAELYLNRAECNAELGNVQECLNDINKIRRRAGATELTEEMVNTSGMSLMEWVRNERACEFFAEGKRFFDVRRWVKGEEYFGLGKRLGLNAITKENPTFEEFNTPMSIPYHYTFGKKLYLYPVHADDVYANPQLEQSPGY